MVSANENNPGTNSFKVGAKTVGSGYPTFIIAEIGNNHNGSLQMAKKMVDEATMAGADAVKFQMRDMASLYGKSANEDKDSLDLGAQYTLDLLAKYQLTNDEMREVFQYCRSKGILAFCTPWDLNSVEVLESFGVELYKVASADLTNHPLLRCLAKTDKPLICSTGMSNESEVFEAAKLLREVGATFSLLHCNSTYPAPFKDINLLYMKHLQELCPIVGYSGHERGFHVAIAAVALGACVIEKHFTLDKTLEGVDHKVSLLPQEFATMVQQVRELESALGAGGNSRSVSQGELMNRENLGKSIVAKVDIEVGHTLTAEDLTVRSPGQGLPPYMLDDLIGTVAKRQIAAGEAFFRSDLASEAKVKPKDYKFSRPWGVPVRYHDTEKFLKLVKPDFIEFHLSYGDMELNPSKYISPRTDVGFTVHAPELFAGDHLVDLCSKNPRYLAESLDNMRRVIEVTRELKKLFPKTKRPFIVASIGGFTTDRPLTAAERQPLYEDILRSLRKLETPDVEILPQSTAPFPWHMGGQQYQNLFLYPEETADFCKRNGYRITLDISHSYLACNHLKIDPRHFFTAVAPYTAHLHLGDCTGVDGEGMQIGEGVVDFPMLAEVFQRYCPDAWFIPEIWQGHKNDGEGFWVGLNRLEKWF